MPRLPPRYRAGDLTCHCPRLARTGVLPLPGPAYDQPAHPRSGFGRTDMPDTLDLFEPTSPPVDDTNGQQVIASYPGRISGWLALAAVRCWLPRPGRA